MDKIHGKANKLFDDISKTKNKMTKNTNKDSTKKYPDHITDLCVKCCIHCQKAFFNSKYLMKHLWRRHSEEVVLLYRNLPSYGSKNNSSELQNFKAILKEEFSSLKKELVIDKLAVNEKNENDFCKEKQTIKNDETIYSIRNSHNTNGNIISNEIGDLKEKTLDLEKDLQNLNDKFVELDNILKNEVLMKQNINETLVLNNKKIMEAQESQFVELRQILLNELKSLIFNKQQENSNEWKSELLELKREIKRLDYAINNFEQQHICTDSLKEEIKKEIVPHVIPHISGKKSEKKKPKTSLHKTELSIDKSHQTPFLSKVSEHDNLDHRESNFRSLKNPSRFTAETHDELVSAVAEKMSQLSIEPGTFKLSSDEFNKKLTLLCINREQLCKKYDNFDEMYDYINMIADQKAHCKLKSKRHHKVKFSEPLISSKNILNCSNTPFEDSIQEQSPLVQKVNKPLICVKSVVPSNFKHVSQKQSHESECFTFPDKGASGDSVYHFSKKHNMSTMKHTKLHSVKEFGTSDQVEENSTDLNATFSKGNSTVIIDPLKNDGQLNSVLPTEQRKLNFMVHSPSVHIDEIPILKTSDKLNELEGSCKSDDEFDDVSSLEAYNCSDSDGDHIADNL